MTFSAVIYTQVSFAIHQQVSITILNNTHNVNGQLRYTTHCLLSFPSRHNRGFPTITNLPEQSNFPQIKLQKTLTINTRQHSTITSTHTIFTSTHTHTDTFLSASSDPPPTTPIHPHTTPVFKQCGAAGVRTNCIYTHAHSTQQTRLHHIKTAIHHHHMSTPHPYQRYDCEEGLDPSLSGSGAPTTAVSTAVSPSAPSSSHSNSYGLEMAPGATFNTTYSHLDDMGVYGPSGKTHAARQVPQQTAASVADQLFDAAHMKYERLGSPNETPMAAIQPDEMFSSSSELNMAAAGSMSPLSGPVGSTAQLDSVLDPYINNADSITLTMPPDASLGLGSGSSHGLNLDLGSIDNIRRHSEVSASNLLPRAQIDNRASISHQVDFWNMDAKPKNETQNQDTYNEDEQKIDRELSKILGDYNLNFTDPFAMPARPVGNTSTSKPTAARRTSGQPVHSPQSPKQYSVSKRQPQRYSVPNLQMPLNNHLLSRVYSNQGSQNNASNPWDNAPVPLESPRGEEDDVDDDSNTIDNALYPRRILSADATVPVNFDMSILDNGAQYLSNDYLSNNLSTGSINTPAGPFADGMPPAVPLPPDLTFGYNNKNNNRRSNSTTPTTLGRLHNSDITMSSTLGGAPRAPMTNPGSRRKSRTPSVPGLAGIPGMTPMHGSATTISSRDGSDDVEKPFLCSTCGKSFRRSEHLRRHIRSVHSLERPFSCTLCDKKFSRSDNLSQHLKTHKRNGEM